jgi:hypothetical protein
VTLPDKPPATALSYSAGGCATTHMNSTQTNSLVDAYPYSKTHSPNRICHCEMLTISPLKSASGQSLNQNKHKKPEKQAIIHCTA